MAWVNSWVMVVAPGQQPALQDPRDASRADHILVGEAQRASQHHQSNQAACNP